MKAVVPLCLGCAVLVTAFMVGCTGENDPSVLSQNAQTLAGPGVLVGKLPDGREVRRYWIDRGSHDDHVLYVVTGTATVNWATTEQVGKTTVTRHHAAVVVDGVTYVPVKEPPKAEKE